MNPPKYAPGANSKSSEAPPNVIRIVSMTEFLIVLNNFNFEILTINIDIKLMHAWGCQVFPGFWRAFPN